MAENNNLHILLLYQAQNFIFCADEIKNGSNRTFPSPDVYLPMHYLYFHGIELALKSYIYFKQKSEKQLRRIGHDLEEAWDTAKGYGIGEFFPGEYTMTRTIQLVNPMYKGKELEYYFIGSRNVPEPNNLSFDSSVLIGALNKCYKEYDELNK